MFQTKNDLSQTVRERSIALLQKRLADAIDLMLQSKQAHWNVKGPTFIALHKLFDEIHEETEGYVDLMAERITQFGGIAEGTAQSVAGDTSLPEYPLTISEEADHLNALSTALATFGKQIREAIDQSASWDDAGTADIFTAISRGVDKNLWFVESHLASARAESRKVKGVA